MLRMRGMKTPKCFQNSENCPDPFARLQKRNLSTILRITKLNFHVTNLRVCILPNIQQRNRAIVTIRISFWPHQ